MITAIGCSNTAREPTPIGIAEVQVTTSSVAITIHGLDARGVRVASARATRGTFTMQEDGRTVDGRRLELDVLGQRATHESEGYRRLELPLFEEDRDAALSDFLRDPRVSIALASWDITFGDGADHRQGEPPSEIAFDNFCGLYPPTSGCAATSCSETQARVGVGSCELGYNQYVCCSSIASRVRRFCGVGGVNPCGTEGPGGCAVCWTQPDGGSCNTWHAGPYWTEECGGFEYYAIGFN
jgi:hypothetical protein